MRVWKVKAVRGHGWVADLDQGHARFTAIEAEAYQFTAEQAERVVAALNRRRDRVPVMAVEVEVDGPQAMLPGHSVRPFRDFELTPLGEWHGPLVP